MTRENGSRGTPEEESLPKFERVQGRDGQWYLACGEVITFLFEYLDDEVPQERRTEFDDHLAVCPSCRNYLATYSETLRLVRRTGQLDEIEIPALPQDLVDIIGRSRQR
jgi:predicted anti-sigma-YlaC factor YlaD